MMSEQLLVIVDGPDGVGKTEISRELAKRLEIPYFKPTNERTNWKQGDDGFLNELLYGERRQLQLAHQTGMSFVQDRGYPSEYVYSYVYNRKTSGLALSAFDCMYAELGATVIIPLLRDYSAAREDDLIDEIMLPKLHERYLTFADWTRCRKVVMYVDDLGRDIDREMDYIAGCTGWRISS